MGDEIELGLSFDDVLLVPQHSGVLPADVRLDSRITDAIPLQIPVLSSAMDTVSEDALAIALAREGGMGVIHRNCPVEIQAAMVAKVKRSENIIIDNPMTVDPDMTIAELRAMIEQTGINGFPVVNKDGILTGIVSRRDIWITEANQAVRDVMTPKDRLITGSMSASIEESRKVLYKHRIEKLPLVDDEGKLVGLMTTADIEKRMMYSNAAKDASGHLRVGAAIGVGEDAMRRSQALVEAGADALFIDAATGHTDRVVDLIRKVRELGDVPVVAGNVVTAQGAIDLIEAGASAIKVGVGPGSICTTRVIAGVGVPQFTAVRNAAQACRERGIPCVADGGIRYSGDIVKALAAGADCVMLGSLLAGTEESPGDTVRWQGRAFKEYRGMGSMTAMRKGSGDRYGQNSSGKLVPEGVEARVPYKGSLSQTVFQLMGGLRSGMGYVGAGDLEALRAKAVFNRITAGGLKESHPHDILITEEPVNYPTM